MSSEPLHSQAADRSWEHRRTWNQTWTNSDTERWIDDRSAAAVAWVSRFGVKFRRGREPKFMGPWLREKLRGNFSAAHEALVKMDRAQREQAQFTDVFPSSATKALDSEPPFPNRA